MSPFFFLHHQTHYVKYKNDPQGWKLWYFLEKIPLTWNNNNFCPAFGIKWGIPVFHLWLSPLVNPPPPVTVGESPSPVSYPPNVMVNTPKISNYESSDRVEIFLKFCEISWNFNEIYSNFRNREISVPYLHIGWSLNYFYLNLVYFQ